MFRTTHNLLSCSGVHMHSTPSFNNCLNGVVIVDKLGIKFTKCVSKNINNYFLLLVIFMWIIAFILSSSGLTQFLLKNNPKKITSGKGYCTLFELNSGQIYCCIVELAPRV